MLKIICVFLGTIFVSILLVPLTVYLMWYKKWDWEQIKTLYWIWFTDDK